MVLMNLESRGGVQVCASAEQKTLNQSATRRSRADETERNGRALVTAQRRISPFVRSNASTALFHALNRLADGVFSPAIDSLRTPPDTEGNIMLFYRLRQIIDRRRRRCSSPLAASRGRHTFKRSIERFSAAEIALLSRRYLWRTQAKTRRCTRVRRLAANKSSAGFSKLGKTRRGPGSRLPRGRARERARGSDV